MPDLLWLDLETTGLSPAHHTILEVAARVTPLDRPFDRLGARYAGVLQWRGDRTLLTPAVRMMHEKNGLLVQCETSALRLDTVETYLLRLVPEVADPSEKTMLAGFSVHFDLQFIRHHMPQLASRLSHRVYDVTAVKFFCRSLGMTKLPKTEVHRAVDDLEASVQDAESCAKWLLGARTRAESSLLRDHSPAITQEN